jgi:hypothetical protein
MNGRERFLDSAARFSRTALHPRNGLARQYAYKSLQVCQEETEQQGVPIYADILPPMSNTVKIGCSLAAFIIVPQETGQARTVKTPKRPGIEPES